MQTRNFTISNEAIAELKSEAREAGDYDQVILCAVALGEHGDDYVIDGDDFTGQSPSFRKYHGATVDEARAICAAVICGASED